MFVLRINFLRLRSISLMNQSFPPSKLCYVICCITSSSEVNRTGLRTTLKFLHYFLSFLPDICFCLRLTEVRIPNHVTKNSTVQLECHFDLNGEALYSVKWYKDGNEFYRYVPRDNPPAQLFLLTGVSVDVSTTLLLLFMFICVFVSRMCSSCISFELEFQRSVGFSFGVYLLLHTATELDCESDSPK